MERRQGSEGHSLPGDSSSWDWLGHGKLARGTHFLKRIDIKTVQDTKRKPVSKGHSLAGGADIKTGQDMEIK